MDCMNLLKLGFSCFTTYYIFSTIYAERKNFDYAKKVWKRFRIKMLLQSLLVLCLVGFTAFQLLKVPLLQIGWYNLLFHSNGNVMVAPMSEGTKSSSAILQLMTIVFLSVLIVALPFLAKYEEDMFRRGNYRWKKITKRSVIFGLMHLFMGVPLAAALALIISGLFYSYIYRTTFIKHMRAALHLGKANLNEVIEASRKIEIGERIIIANRAEEAAFLESTAYHTMSNTLLLSVALLVTILSFIF